MEPLISIIMPLYNAERFLEETLVSINKQVFQDYELICINDGSNDRTVDIVQRFQGDDSRIKLLHNGKRFGAAISRNRGVKEAKGKYIIFLDGDDIFDEEMLLLAYEKAEDVQAEIVMFEMTHALSEDIYKECAVVHSTEYILKFCTDCISVYDIKVCDFLRWSSGTCNKLFLREFINSNNLEFQDVPSNNDTYFVDMSFFLAKRIVLLNSPRMLLHARDHYTPDRISVERDPMCIYYAMKKVKEELIGRGLFGKAYKIFLYRAFDYMIIGLKNAKNAEIQEKFFHFLLDKGFNDLLQENGYEMDQFLKNKKAEFINWKLGKGWEKIESIFEIFLEENFEIIGNIFQECKMKNLSMGIWGAGENGKRFITFCKKHKLDIDKVIDMDESKCGKVIEGYQIVSSKNAYNTNIIIFTPVRGYASVKKMMYQNKKDVRIINLNDLICFT